MNCIYEPKGRAREYSPFALNIYTDCDHNCKYCYIKNGRFYKKRPIDERKDLILNLEKQLKRQKFNKQVLLCFSGDPYCHADVKIKATRKVLEILKAYNVPVAILTKGGERCLRDLDIFKKFGKIKVGATLTFLSISKSKIWEPNAALPNERLQMLKVLHKNGIKTWVSFEPVIEPDETLSLIEEVSPYIDEIKVGMLNHLSLRNSINWEKFGNEAIRLLRRLKKDFYIKEDLRRYVTEPLNENEINYDFLSLTNNIPQTIQMNLI